MRSQQVRFDEHDLRFDQVELARLILQRIGGVGITGTSFALERHELAQQREVVIVEYAEPGIATLQIESCVHHVDDTVGQQVILAKAVAALTFDIDDARSVAIGVGQVFADDGKIDLHTVVPRKCRL